MTQRTRIKICGLTTPAHAHAVAQAGADAIGLVFAAGSPRLVNIPQARAIAKAAGPFVEVVGLFVDHTVAEIQTIADTVGLTMIQLHGEYSANDIKTLAPRRVLRAVHFDEESAHDILTQWEKQYRELENLVGLLVDTPDPNAAGGTGKSFDWQALHVVLDQVQSTVPIVLAGGLNATNVQRAIQTLNPWAVDVSSGVEVQRGVKDTDLINTFCEAVR